MKHFEMTEGVIMSSISFAFILILSILLIHLCCQSPQTKPNEIKKTFRSGNRKIEKERFQKILNYRYVPVSKPLENEILLQ